MNTDHIYRKPRQIECKVADAPGTCSYCHRPSAIQKTGQCRYCGTWMPSPLSYISTAKLRQRRKAPRTEYSPQFDGCFDPDPLDRCDL